MRAEGFHIHIPPPPHPPPGIAGAPRGEAATVAYNFHHPADMKVLVPQVVGSHVWAHILQLLRTRQDTKTTIQPVLHTATDNSTKRGPAFMHPAILHQAPSQGGVGGGAGWGGGGRGRGGRAGAWGGGGFA